jgi:glyoxylase-like metal-dependent hydrolase (beta-lactamase superfamily II)
MTETAPYREVRAGLYWVHPPDGGEVYFVRAGGGELVMVDSGFYKHREFVRAGMERLHLDPRAIRLGFMTHFHSDHVGGMGWWKTHFGFPVVAHGAGVPAVESGDRLVTGSAIPYAGVDEPFIACRVDHPVRGGETFTVGDARFDVDAAPGHSVRGIHVRWGDVVFVGDNLFGDGSIGWMDVHWGSNPEDYVETLRRLKRHVGRLVCSAHGEPFALRESVIDHAIALAAFYIPTGHGLGRPRAPSQHRPDAGAPPRSPA